MKNQSGFIPQVPVSAHNKDIHIRSPFEEPSSLPKKDTEINMASALNNRNGDYEEPNPFLTVALPEEGTIRVNDHDGMLRFSIRLSNGSNVEAMRYKLTTSRALSPLTAALPNPGRFGPGEMIIVQIATRALDATIPHEIVLRLGEGPLKFGVKSEMVTPQYELTTYKYKNYFECEIDNNLEASFGVTTSSPGRVLRSGRRSHIGNHKTKIKMK